MRALYTDNTPDRFWRLLTPTPVRDADWLAAMRAALGELPAACRPHATDAVGLLAAILGEGQFGSGHWQLSRARRAYYAVKPLLPRWAIVALRRAAQSTSSEDFALGWPMEDRYARFQYATVANLLRGLGEPSLPFIHFWPDDRDFAFVLTHDVETQAGHDFVPELMRLEEKYGFRSSFNFVPQRYRVDPGLLDTLRAAGFEVGVHGLVHDGKLFSSRATFERRAARINQVLAQWDAVGFRSPLTHRQPEWMQSLAVEYDLSFFDTDPFEPIAGGTMSLWPFFIGRFTELPYTLVQDHTLLEILGERTPQRWLDKVAFLAQYCGMALVNVHPDYLQRRSHLAVYESFLQAMTEWINYWHALPRDVARWWRQRAEAQVEWHNGQWNIRTLPRATLRQVQLQPHGIAIRPARDRGTTPYEVHGHHPDLQRAR
jgi:hypothetical protein